MITAQKPADTQPEIEAGYNYGFLDEATKRMIRRTILTALSIPGYQVPFGSREMPMAYGWGTGGVQLSAALLGPGDTFKCIDQGADDTTNAVSIKKFFRRLAAVETTEATDEADIIQTRHRTPEHPLKEGQIIVYQVPQPEVLRFMEPRETETRALHAYEEYGLQYVALYEDVTRNGWISSMAGYPVKVNDRYIMTPSPIPSYDNPKLDNNPAIQLYGAGREKRIQAIPPYTKVKSLDFEDKPFRVQSWSIPCELCGSTESYLDEIVTDDKGGRMYVCSDSYYCAQRRAKSSLPKVAL
ncbi:MAG: alpha-D-ribose 1-methylphosphonate 5-phosphate C-P-lyase PhnJ [Pseudomonadota bacterium]